MLKTMYWVAFGFAAVFGYLFVEILLPTWAIIVAVIFVCTADLLYEHHQSKKLEKEDSNGK